MKKLYLVRHGETDHNAGRIHQFPETPLSEVGMHQAQSLAKRFVHLPIDIIIASDYVRTQQTAGYINEVVKKEIVYSELLREIKRPSEIRGMHIDSPESQAIRQTMKEHGEDAAWHYSDEENFYDFKARVQRALAMLHERQEDHILVVTHGVFIKMVMGFLTFGDELTGDMFGGFLHTFHLTNTGITLCQPREEGKLEIITWNDHAHLGEPL